MLAIRAEQTFTIGTVQGVPQPVVISNRLRNVPEEGIYNWDPGAHFGIYHPDTFWWADGAKAKGN
jgi:peptide/nickel transport system substrate-binding protein